jgi:SNF2 family DNA or RNA helicase
MSVLPRDDGSFGVTLGSPPYMHWYATDDPPSLGVEVEVQGRVVGQQPLAAGRKTGTMTILASAVQTVKPSPYATRVVADEWLQRVNAAMDRPLMAYQATGAAWMAQRLVEGKGAILADSPGLGKSAQSIAAVCGANAFPCIVVCPASVKVNWAREFQYSKAKPNVFVIEGTRNPIEPADVYVVNYALLKPLEGHLIALHPASMIFDEAHELKEPRPKQSHRAAIATRMANWVKRVILLTGSPIMNTPREIWRLLHIAEPAAWDNFEDFNNRYLRPPPDDELTPKKRIVTARGRAEYLDELQVRVQPVMLRRRKEEVQGDMPPKTRRSLLVGIGKDDRAAYDEAERDLIDWLKKLGHDDRARRAARTEALAKMTYLRRIACIGKLRHAVPEYLDGWFSKSERPPLVIFGYHRVVLDALRPMCMNLGLRTVGIQGSEDMATRQEAIDAFQRGDADVFLCPIKAGGVGITLHRSSDMLVLERDWSPARMGQSEDRIHRIGQKRPVTITYMDAAATVDEHIAEVLAAKQHLIDHVVDGGQSEVEALVETVDSVLDHFRAA